ncbi:MAG: hypothetical protein ACTHXO_11455 [Actinomycetaceae bacterium]
MRRPLPTVLLAGLALLVASCATLILRGVGFGWTQTTPVTLETTTPGVLVLDGVNSLALLGLLSGLSLVAGVAGYRLARRRPPSRTNS